MSSATYHSLDPNRLFVVVVVVFAETNSSKEPVQCRRKPQRQSPPRKPSRPHRARARSNRAIHLQV